MIWLLLRTMRRSLRRVVLGAIGVGFPVAMLGATLLLVDDATHAMTRVALQPVQVEMRALATSLNVDMAGVDGRLAGVSGVRRIDRFASAEITVSVPAGPGQAAAAPVRARLIAVDPQYLTSHPWVKVVQGGLDGGALLSQPLRASGAFVSATGVVIDLPGEDGPVPLPLKVGGTADLRQATTWFAVPLGEVQGDIANVPNALVVDYPTFERSILPALRRAAGAEGLNPSTTDLPPVTLEAHVAIDHDAYPSDPARAALFSTRLRRVLEQRAPGNIVVADNAAEALAMAQMDATNAKILFLLLGIPGALVAAGLGLAAAAALTEARRREEALLQLRGATGVQRARLAAAESIVAGTVGALLGLAGAVAAVSAVTGRQVWRTIPPERMAVSMLLALLAGALTIAARVVPLVRAARHAEVAKERRLVELGWEPGWRRTRLDLIAIAIGVLILLVNAATGGLRQTPIEGQTLALAFYVMLAPIALWLGGTLFLVRVLRALLIRRTRPERARPLGTWSGTALRWLGRRPARTGIALVLGALAVAFGANVVAFAATYQEAQRADTRAALGADLRLTPLGDAALPTNPGLAATSPIRLVGARVGSDRKTIMAIDPESYGRASTVAPRMLSGVGLDGLRRDRTAVLIAAEVADGFALRPGDTLTLTIYPDDPARTKNLSLHVAGVFRSFPPNEPLAELVTTVAALPQPLPAVDYHMARVAPGHRTSEVADGLRAAPSAAAFTVTTVAGLTVSERRSLTTLNLRALGRLEAIAAGLIAGVGIAVLGAFLVLERRRESAILRAAGATTAQILTPPVVEGSVAAVGGLLIGLPVGLGVAIVAIRVLQLFFTLPPPLVVVPTAALAGLVAFMLVFSTLAFSAALRRVTREAAASALREP